LRGRNRVSKNLNRIENKLPQRKRRWLFESIKDAKNRIYFRTKKGVDVNGDRFKKYSKHPASIRNPYSGKSQFYEKGYWEFRKKTGRSTTPNLYYTGKMFSKLQPLTVSKNRARLGFIDQKAEKKAQSNNETREFFGLSKKDKKSIRNELKRKIRRFLRYVVR